MYGETNSHFHNQQTYNSQMPASIQSSGDGSFSNNMQQDYQKADIMNFYPPTVSIDGKQNNTSGGGVILSSSLDGCGGVNSSLDHTSSVLKSSIDHHSIMPHGPPLSSRKANRANQLSPISLRGIINKLEKVEREEKETQQQGASAVYPKANPSTVKKKRNSSVKPFQTLSLAASLDKGAGPQAVLQEKYQTLTHRAGVKGPTAIKSRNASLRAGGRTTNTGLNEHAAIDSNFGEVDGGFLPNLSSAAKGDSAQVDFPQL